MPLQIAVALALALTIPVGRTQVISPNGPPPGSIAGVLHTNRDRATEGDLQLRNANTSAIVFLMHTDRAGAFLFDPVPPGTYFVECVDAKTGLIAGTSAPVVVLSGARAASRLAIDPAATTTGKPGAFRGYLWAADNLPVQRARIELRDVSTKRVVLNATTDKLGEFRFPELPPGKYRAEYVAPDGKQVLATSPLLDVHSDEERAAFISMTPRGAVMGIAVSTNDSMLADADIQLRETAGQVVMATMRSGPTGEFRFEAVWPGWYTVELVAPGTHAVIGVTAAFYVSAGASVPTMVKVSKAPTGQ